MRALTRVSRIRGLRGQSLPVRCAVRVGRAVLLVIGSPTLIRAVGRTNVPANARDWRFVAAATVAAALGGFVFGRRWPAFAHAGRAGQVVCATLAGATGGATTATGLFLGVALGTAWQGRRIDLVAVPVAAAVAGAVLGAGIGAISPLPATSSTQLA